MNLTDRVRGVLKTSTNAAAGSSSPVPAPANVSLLEEATLERSLGGEWRTAGGGRYFTVEHHVPGDVVHGRTLVRDMAARLERHCGQASLLTGGAAARIPFVFLDLETTGLSGGAGTYAFLVGCGSFTDNGAFVVRQYLMTSPHDEPVMLQAIARELETAGALVSFNGKSFDAPVLETRYLFHRLAWAGAAVTHVDALHPARQFWGESAPKSSCSLIALEAQVLGARRVGDVPGVEVPARYFRFIRTGDARPLVAVLEHNRLDLLSLAGLTARLLDIVAGEPSAIEDAREAYALGRIYRRSGLDGRAHDAFARALDLANGRRFRGAANDVRVATLHALALSDRRARRYGDAAARWHALVDMPDCPPHLLRAATEALAIHHEHRVRDLPVAKAFALQSLDDEAGSTWRRAVERRLTRLDRKIDRNLGQGVVDLPMQMLWSAEQND